MSAKKVVDYQEMNRRLDEIVSALQSPDVSIEEAIALHKEGTALIADMQTYLKTAENHITKLTSDTIDD